MLSPAGGATRRVLGALPACGQDARVSGGLRAWVFSSFSVTERPAEAGTPTGAAQDDGWSLVCNCRVRPFHPMRTIGLLTIVTPPVNGYLFFRHIVQQSVPRKGVRHEPSVHARSSRTSTVRIGKKRVRSTPWNRQPVSIYGDLDETLAMSPFMGSSPAVLLSPPHAEVTFKRTLVIL